MNGTRHDLFPGTALTQNQHRVRALGSFPNKPIELLYFCGSPDEAAKTLMRFEPPAPDSLFGLEPEMRGNVFQQQLEFSETERLGEIVVSAGLHSLDRRFHCPTTGHHNNFDLRMAAFDFLQRF